MSVSQFHPRWLIIHLLAFGFSLSHVILDWHLNLYGALIPTSLSTTQALVLISGVVVYAGWTGALVLAGQGDRRALIATIALSGIGGLGNGLSIVACLPPCSGAAPFGDISHIGSLIFGIWAMVESWRALRQSSFVSNR